MVMSNPTTIPKTTWQDENNCTNPRGSEKCFLWPPVVGEWDALFLAFPQHESSITLNPFHQLSRIHPHICADCVAPPVICWSISPSNYGYKHHKL